MSNSLDQLKEPEELAVFIGRWRAEGASYGGTDQSGEDPRANGVPWTSEHSAYWYSGEFFMVQDERAMTGDAPFDTLWVMGRDAGEERMFARTFENHGHCRDYHLKRDGNVWTISGATERATIRFRNDNREQVITWEWKPDDRWLPLCDRIAAKIEEE